MLYSDVWGSAPFLPINGYRYYILYVDDFTRYVWPFLLRQKFEATIVFFHFNKLVESVKSGKNLIFLKKGKTVISVENWNFSRSLMMKRTSPLNLSRKI